MDEAEEHWVENEDPDCPICAGRMSAESIAHLEAMAADPVPLLDYRTWIDGLIARDQRG
jgi:hypothetical protein